MIVNIPKSVTYIVAPKRHVMAYAFSGTVNEGMLTGDMDDDEEDSQDRVTLEAFPIYISDTSNKKTLETGRIWAKSKTDFYDYSTKKSVKNKTLPDEVVRDNTPFSGIRILSIEHRGKGGRAWKCLIEDGKYYIDLREHILLEAMAHAGIKKGALLEGEYIWGKEGSEMRLIRVGSGLHKELTQATDYKTSALIPRKELEAGTVYRERNGNFRVCLGRVKTLKNKTNSKVIEGQNTRLRQHLWLKGALKPSQYREEGEFHRLKVSGAKVDDPGVLLLDIEEVSEVAWGILDSSEITGKMSDGMFQKAFGSNNKLYLTRDNVSSYCLNNVMTIGGGQPIEAVGKIDVSSFLKKVRGQALKAYMRDIAENKKHANEAHLHIRQEERSRAEKAAEYLVYGSIFGENEVKDQTVVDGWRNMCLSQEPK